MNNLTTSLILAIAIAVVFIVISAVAYKLHLKNKNTRILKKIHNNEYSLDELKEYYYQSLSRIKKTGAKAYLAMPIVYVLSDSSNYFVSLNSIYRENVAMLLILTLTLSIILDHTPTAISEYIFSKEKESTISNKSQKYIGIAIGLLVAVMFNTPDGAPLDIDYPSVTPVTASDIGNHFVYADTTTNESINLKDDVLCFNDVSLSFQPDSAELITSENEALKVLSPVISYATSQDVTIAVFASTAWSDDKEALYDLSSARANTVKTLLIKAGVQEESIRCYPLGYDLNPLKCDCFDSSGEWDEDNAKKNRVVYITDASSSVANVFYQNLD